MPDPKKIKMFTFQGLIQMGVFCLIIFRILALEYIDDQTMTLGTASAFLLLFIGTFIIAGSLNTGK
jgi:hypothetical protein